MQMKADTSHILMSDALKGTIPELEDEQVDAIKNRHVTVVAEKSTADGTEGMVGILKGVLLGSEPEIEFKCDLKEALGILSADSLLFNVFELHHDESVVSIPGPFSVKAARIDEINVVDQLCTLGLHLMRRPR